MFSLCFVQDIRKPKKYVNYGDITKQEGVLSVSPITKSNNGSGDFRIELAPEHPLFGEVITKNSYLYIMNDNATVRSINFGPTGSSLYRDYVISSFSGTCISEKTTFKEGYASKELIFADVNKRLEEINCSKKEKIFGEQLKNKLYAVLHPYFYTYMRDEVKSSSDSKYDVYTGSNLFVDYAVLDNYGSNEKLTVNTLSIAHNLTDGKVELFAHSVEIIDEEYIHKANDRGIHYQTEDLIASTIIEATIEDPKLTLSSSRLNDVVRGDSDTLETYGCVEEFKEDERYSVLETMNNYCDERLRDSKLKKITVKTTNENNELFDIDSMFNGKTPTTLNVTLGMTKYEFALKKRTDNLLEHTIEFEGDVIKESEVTI